MKQTIYNIILIPVVIAVLITWITMGIYEAIKHYFKR